MQIKKEDLREKIIASAETEFLKRGFKGASMRTIAKKANTTLGNIYNYFGSKEDLLDAVVGDMPLQVERLLEEHKTASIDLGDSALVSRLIDETDPKDLGIDIFLNQRFVILMECCEDTKYQKYREEILNLGKEHVLGHLKHRPQYDKFAEIMAMTFFNGMLFIAKTSKSMEEAKDNFMRLYKLVCTGLIDENEKGDKTHD